MQSIPWEAAAPAISAAFLASFVEVVEAFTIVLAVGLFQGWRPALLGSTAGLALLAALVVALGPLIGAIPIHALQFGVGLLLLLFGTRWLRKAILRAAGVLPLHDEAAAFAEETAQLREQGCGQARRHNSQLDWSAGLTAFKAVMLEGVEVVFIIVAVGAGRGMLWPASIGALAACAIVLLIGLLVHKPLSRVPENIVKLGVGVLLSAFGVFWSGQGLGIDWPGSDLAVLAFAAVFLTVGLTLSALLRRSVAEVAP